jgi:hypothetical protein
MKTLVVVFFLLMGPFLFARNNPMYRYVVTETGKPTSLDPLDGDQTQNLSVARMIYTTPLEITQENKLSSLVLESFSYNTQTRTIEWAVKKDLKFNDGTDLGVEDIAFAVSRMAFTRPRFPVVEHIEGLDKWLKEAHPLKSLPSGIKIEGNVIKIKLTKDHEHPLFRFCLEIFSIIPKKCVNPENSKLTCQKIPGSGYYVISDESQDAIIFKRSSQKQKYFSGPEQIEFKYISASELLGKMAEVNENTIVAGNEVQFTIEDLKAIGSHTTVQNLPAARFAVLQLNPSVGPFKDKLCRQIFVKEFRESFAKIAQGAIRAESSIFVSIVPGYMTDKELSEKSVARIKPKEIENCKNEFKKSNYQWGYVKDERNLAFKMALEMTFKNLSVGDKKPLVLENRKQQSEEFLRGKIAVFNAGSGFWPLDPAGDLQMLFTPNLHKPLEHITKDETLQKLIRKVQDDESGPSAYKEVNQFLYDDALFNVYAHVRRFFAAKNKDLLLKFPEAITSPAPWQVFKGT